MQNNRLPIFFKGHLVRCCQILECMVLGLMHNITDISSTVKVFNTTEWLMFPLPEGYICGLQI